MNTDGHSIGQSEEVTKSELLSHLYGFEVRVKQLEQEKRDLREELREERKARKEAIKNEQIARTQTVQKAKDDANSEVEELHETVVAEQKTRSRNDSKLAKRSTTLENEIGVETNPAKCR